MRKFLLSIIITLATTVSASAVDWQWGTPTWNIQDGWEFQNYEDYAQSKIILTYPNPSNYQLNFFQMLAVEYNVYVDGVGTSGGTRVGKAKHGDRAELRLP